MRRFALVTVASCLNSAGPPHDLWPGFDRVALPTPTALNSPMFRVARRKRRTVRRRRRPGASEIDCVPRHKCLSLGAADRPTDQYRAATVVRVRIARSRCESGDVSQCERAGSGVVGKICASPVHRGMQTCPQASVRVRQAPACACTAHGGADARADMANLVCHRLCVGAFRAPRGGRQCHEVLGPLRVGVGWLQQQAVVLGADAPLNIKHCLCARQPRPAVAIGLLERHPT